jgi:hypothetical protein
VKNDDLLKCCTRCASCVEGNIDDGRVYCSNSYTSNYPYAIIDKVECGYYIKMEELK